MVDRRPLFGRHSLLCLENISKSVFFGFYESILLWSRPATKHIWAKTKAQHYLDFHNQNKRTEDAFMKIPHFLQTLCSLKAKGLLEWPQCMWGGFGQRFEFETWCRSQGNISCNNAKTPDKNNMISVCCTLQVDTCTRNVRIDENDHHCVYK